MKILQQITVSLISGMTLFYISALSAISHPLYAQMNNTNLDDLPDNSQQMKTWACSKGDSNIEVEAKDVNFWQEVIETQGWQCDEQIEPISQSDVKLSCDPYDVIGNLTIVWVKGKQGQPQLQAWMKQLSETPGMICRMGEEGSWGETEDL